MCFEPFPYIQEVKMPHPREVLWCVPSLHKATHKRPQSRKKGGKDGQGRKRRSGEEKAVRGGKTPRGGNNPKKMPARAADTRPV